MRSAQLQVIVEDMGADATLYVAPGHDPVLYLRPGQTYDSAVRAVQAALDDDDRDTARRIVRKHLPNAPRLDRLMEPSAPQAEDVRFVQSMLALRTVAVVIVLMLAAWAILQMHIAHDFDRLYQERPDIDASGRSLVTA